MAHTAGPAREIHEVYTEPTLARAEHVPVAEVLAKVWPPASGRGARDVEELVRGALSVGAVRDLERSRGYGVQQLADIGWTTISTSKQNPQPGRQAILALRDLLARWSQENARDAQEGEEALQVVYRDDVPQESMHALELLAVRAATCAPAGDGHRGGAGPCRSGAVGRRTALAR